MSKRPEDIEELHRLAQSTEIPPTAAGALGHLEAHLARKRPADKASPPDTGKHHSTDSIVITNLNTTDDRDATPGRTLTHAEEKETAEATSQHARGTRILHDEESRREYRRPSKPRRPSDFGRDL